jgi:Spy/CpxP family protein refolding chaperone
MRKRHLLVLAATAAVAGTLVTPAQAASVPCYDIGFQDPPAVTIGPGTQVHVFPGSPYIQPRPC